MRNERYSRALNREAQNIPPIWMMRQAGRYHKHYQSLRKKYSFMELCKKPELAAEVALGPIQDFDFDLAILFSDILFPLEGLGMGLKYSDSKGPELNWYLSEDTIMNLSSEEEAISFLQFQAKALQYTRELLPPDKSLIGFIGGAWTLYCYAIEGKHSGNLINPKIPISLRDKFLQIIESLLIKNIAMQLENQAEVVMVFDTAAGALSPFEFEQIVIPFLQKLGNTFPGKVAYYAKDASEHCLKKVLRVKGLAGLGVDHRNYIPDILSWNRSGFTQGNFDQVLLFREKNDFLKSLKEYLSPIKELTPSDRKGWVCGLGHGVLPNTPEENVKLFVNTVREELA
ncbi:MAG: uroporphyrinogen decarboxylase [Leptospiraceae bacterium]|nr:uroporphyrinogen decarboxylase [Leptospiraceae bacterium]